MPGFPLSAAGPASCPAGARHEALADDNRLAAETSPYLLQHARNPVDWYPWGPEAFERALAEDKPILLSVGYAACHWCHVMERESFADPAVAALLGATCISVKVDREERPDVDALYMDAVMAFTGGRGGWPMSVFLAPDGRPFFGGTYFPPVGAPGRPSFSDVVRHVAAVWAEGGPELEALLADVHAHVEARAQVPVAPATAPGVDWLGGVLPGLRRSFDAENGGFGPPPRFPPHGALPALLELARAAPNGEAAGLLRATLDGMARGGMRDLLDGGFCRYSTDPRWAVPHFEKMLADNVQLAPIYAEAAGVLGEPAYARVAAEALGWMDTALSLPGGAFAASLDAEAGGVEGAHALWTPAEVEAAVGPTDGPWLAARCGVTAAGTAGAGRSVLRWEEPPERWPAAERERLARVWPALRAAQAARPAPARDDKAVVAWNGLAISAFARCAELLDQPAWAVRAAAAATALEGAVGPDGRLRRVVGAETLAFADDHAALALGLLDLFTTTQSLPWLDRALALADTLVARFWDDAGGGLWYTASDAPALITRSKHLFPGSEPSANALAAWLFARLAALTGRDDLGGRADALLGLLAPLDATAPLALGPARLAGALRAAGPTELAVIGAPDDPATAALWAVARDHAPPGCARVRVDPADLDAWTARVPWLAGKGGPGGARAWLCAGGACHLPARSPAALARLLGG